MAEIVGGNAHRDRIAHDATDLVLLHFAGQLGRYRLPVRKRHGVVTTAGSCNNSSFKFS